MGRLLNKSLNRGVLLLCILFNSYSFFAQNIKIFSQEDRMPLSNVSVYSFDKLIGFSNELGVFDINKKTQIKLSHLGYKDIEINKILNDTVILLEIEEKAIKEVVIQEKKSSNRNKLINSIYLGETNFSFNSKGVVLFKNNKKNIHNISLEIIDVFGVKNIKYKPFKIAIYEFDSIENNLGAKIFESKTLQKEDQKKYFKYVPNSKIDIQSDYFYVAFEILDDTFYNPKFITSNVGSIAAVPSLKLRRINEGVSYKISYDNELQLTSITKIEHGGFNIKIEYDEK